MAKNLSIEKLLASDERLWSAVQMRYQPTLIINTCLLTFICLFGFVGNSLVIYIVGKREFSHRFDCFSRKHRPRSLTKRDTRKKVDEEEASSFIILHRRYVGRSSTQDYSQCDILEESKLNVPSIGATSGRLQRKPTRPYLRSMDRGNSNMLLFLLATNDLLISVVDIPATIFLLIWELNSVKVLCILHVFLKSLLLTVSVLLLLLIAIERWFIICFVPGIRLSPRILVTLISLCYVVGIGWAIPTGMYYDVFPGVKVSSFDQIMQSSSSATVKSDGTNRTNTPIHLGSQTYFKAINNNQTVCGALFTVGRCDINDRLISKDSYKKYQFCAFVFFVVIFSGICVIYGSIFGFAWWHQSRLVRNFFSTHSGGCNARTKQSAPKIDITVNFVDPGILRNTPQATFGSSDAQRYPMPTANTWESNSQVLNQCSDGVNSGIHGSLDKVSGTSCPVAQEDTWIKTVPTLRRVRHHNLPERFFIIERKAKDRQVQIGSKEHKERQTKFPARHRFRPRDSIKGCTGCRINSKRRHLRTAVMFILVTTSFCISYLPHLLISSGLIWRVQWESTSFFSEPQSKTHVVTTALSSKTARNSTRFDNLLELVVPEWIHYLRRLFNYLYFLNVVANPIIYFFLNLQFRGDLRHLLSKLRLHSATQM
ncbi:hypothetical protein CRM22_006761 [Opisthorchis felineus]|uniref:G-protein coupled receptors family 1 profile domain-containing protein n=1 Tax=Opisthorchis felineus TaxID=147828 RepID=A0A4S2LRR5_OPIFE|nr:hypothetical protein CRM22_006761 [Opisthorchis felineus]